MQFNYPLGGHDLFLLVSFYGFLSLNTLGAPQTSGSHKAELCLGELKITWESTDIERSLCKIIMNLTGEFSL